MSDKPVIDKHVYLQDTTAGIGFCEVCGSDYLWDGNHFTDQAEMALRRDLPKKKSRSRKVGLHARLRKNMQYSVEYLRVAADDSQVAFEKALGNVWEAWTK